MLSYHRPFIRRTRSLLRKAGFLGIVNRLLSRQRKSYEEAFHIALKKSVSVGNTVWDIGANVGLYTNYFLDWSGSSGKVVAFEPLPEAVKALIETIKTHQLRDNVILRQVALSDKKGEAFLSSNLQGNNITTTAHIADDANNNGNGILINVSTADEELNKTGEQPNVVKIDVEGFEEDVLRGGEKAFGNSACRHLMVEMHFTRMDERNLGDSASRIISMLKKWGYKIKWVDPSHLHARR